MSEPAGLTMSLDDIIAKNAASRGGRGGHGPGFRGRGSNLAVRGGVQKRSFHQNQNQGTSSSGGLAGRGSNQGRGFRGSRGGGRFSDDRQQQGFYKQQHQQENDRQTNFQGRGFSRGGRGGQHFNHDRDQSGRSFKQPQGQQQAQHQPARQQQNLVREIPQPECFLREDTGEVVVQLRRTEIVTVAPSGEITLNTDGIHTYPVLSGMNDALNLVGLRVVPGDNIQSGDWKISDGHSLIRYYDNIKLPAKGIFTQNRGQIILAAFQNPHAKALALAASAASTAAAVAGGINVMQPSLGSTMGMGAGGMGTTGFQNSMMGSTMGFGGSGFGGGMMGSGGGMMGNGGGMMGSAVTAMGGFGGQQGLSFDMMRRLKAQGRYME